MHELSVTQNIIDIVVQHAERARSKQINTISLVIGELTGLVDDSIQFYFDMISPTTLAAGARLVIHRVPTRLRCRSCSSDYQPVDLNWMCPQCGALGGDVLAGREFLVESIEVE